MRTGQNQNEGGGETGRLNSLGVNAETLEKLLGMMSEKSGGEASNLRRTFVRWAFACPTVELRVEQPGGTPGVLMVVGRDLSATGAGLLHSHFVYPSSRCVVLLTDKLGQIVQIQGMVARCQHFSGVVHEIGVRFDQEIDPREFIASDRVGHGVKLESVEPDKLSGQVLHIEDNSLDAKLLKHHLSKTRITVTHAPTYDEGLKLAKETRYDLLLIDHMLDGSKTGSGLLEVLRESQPNTPAVALTAHDSAAVKQQFESARVNAVLGKPVKVDTLIQTIAEFLSIGPGGGGSIRSTLAVDDPNRDLLPDFVEDLQTKAHALKDLFEKDQAMEAYALCLQIGGVAPPLGFDEVALLAKKAAESLAATMSTEESALHVRSLIEVCEQVEA